MIAGSHHHGLASLLCLGSLALVCLAPVPARAQAEYRTARVSDIRGSLALRGDGDSGVSYVDRNAVLRETDTLWTDERSRAEIELERGSWVRLAEDTKLDVHRLPPSALFRLWTGAVYLDVAGRTEAPVRVKTPAGDVDVLPESVVRVDLSRGERTRVSVVSGRAEVFPDQGASVRLAAGERLYLEADRLPDGPHPFDREDLDDFDRYHRERVDYYIHRPLPRELDRDVLGARDLNDYGSWVVVDRVSYWRPQCDPAWRPYSAGYWSYVPGCGYTWIDQAPWGYATSHYGGWSYRPTYGWLWCPSYAWGPSYVYWASYGDYCGWAPLDPFGRPCYYGPGSFFYPGSSLVIDARSFTFVQRDNFFHGRHHWRYNPGGRLLFPGNELRLSADGFRGIRDVQQEIGIPRDPVRGLTFNPNGTLARDSVLRLENRIPGRRLGLIEQRFRVPGQRDLDPLRSPHPAEPLQQNPGRRLDPGGILRGEEAARRLERSPGGPRTGRTPERQPGGLRPGGGQPGGLQPGGPGVRPGEPVRPAPDSGPRTPGVRSPAFREPAPDRDAEFRRGQRPVLRTPADRTPGDRAPGDRAPFGQDGRRGLGAPGALRAAPDREPDRSPVVRPPSRGEGERTRVEPPRESRPRDERPGGRNDRIGAGEGPTYRDFPGRGGSPGTGDTLPVAREPRDGFGRPGLTPAPAPGRADESPYRRGVAPPASYRDFPTPAPGRTADRDAAFRRLPPAGGYSPPTPGAPGSSGGPAHAPGAPWAAPSGSLTPGAQRYERGGAGSYGSPGSYGAPRSYGSPGGSGSPGSYGSPGRGFSPQPGGSYPGGSPGGGGSGGGLGSGGLGGRPSSGPSGSSAPGSSSNSGRGSGSSGNRGLGLPR